MINGKKYELTDETMIHNGRTLYRIKAIKSFITITKYSSKFVEKGELGGWVESEKNLSQDGRCWIFDDSIVYDKANVSNNAVVSKGSVISENAKIKGNSDIRNSLIGKYVVTYTNAIVDNCWLEGATSSEGIKIYGNSIVKNTEIYCINAKIYTSFIEDLKLGYTRMTVIFKNYYADKYNDINRMIEITEEEDYSKKTVTFYGDFKGFRGHFH